MIKLFGPDRTRIGDPDTEWAVWISGMDDIHAQPNVEAALAFAADHNASACADYDGHPYSPVTYAVVLHNGYAWSSSVEHRAGRNCGVQGCVHCGTDRNIALKTLAERWEQLAESHAKGIPDTFHVDLDPFQRQEIGKTHSYRKAAADLREVLATGRIPHDLATDAEHAGGAAAKPSTAEQPEACGKCKTPFDSGDSRFDGHARFYLTPYCRRCVDLCHDTEIADHRCVICA